MAPRRSTRIADTKKPEPALGKSKVKKPATKKTTKKKTAPTATNKAAATIKKSPAAKSRPAPLKLPTPTKRDTLPPAFPKPPKTFPCACVHKCIYKSLQKNLRIALGSPEFNEDSAVVCACLVHWKCAKLWATTHSEVPTALPCGCPVTERGVEFWCWHQEPVSGRQGGNMEVEDKEEEKMEEEKMEEEKKKKEKKELEKKELEKKAENKLGIAEGSEFDSGTDLLSLVEFTLTI
jgi:hypothetical protein